MEAQIAGCKSDMPSGVANSLSSEATISGQGQNKIQFFGRKTEKNTDLVQSFNKFSFEEVAANSPGSSSAVTSTPKEVINEPAEQGTILQKTIKCPVGVVVPTVRQALENTATNYKFLIPLPGSGGYGVYMLGKSPLSEDQQHILTGFIQKGLRSGSVDLPTNMLEAFKISPDSVRVVSSKDDIDFLPFTPPKGLECLLELYKEFYENDLVKAINGIIKKAASEGVVTIEEKYPESVYLIVMAELIQLIEKAYPEATEKQILILKEHIISLKDILNRKIPDKSTTYEQLKLCDIEAKLDRQQCGLCFTGSTYFILFFGLSARWLESCLNLNEVFSLESARHLTECLSPLTGNLIEIGAGRGMLSAALKKAGKKVLFTSDIIKPEKPWEAIKFFKKDAVDVLKKYDGQHMKVIYLCSWVTSGMFDAMVQTDIPFFLLMLGTSYLRSGSTLSEILDIYGKKIKSVDLNIQGYSGCTEDCKVRLLGVNMPDTDFQEVTRKIQPKYRK